MKDRFIKIQHHGRIKIPKDLKKRYNLNEGDEVLLLEDEGTLRIIPIHSEDELRKDSYNREEMKRITGKIRQQELKREK